MSVVEEQQYLAEILEQYPELVEELKTPEDKFKSKKAIEGSFNGEFYEGAGKIRYSTREDAERALKSCKSRKGGNRKEKRVYMDDDGYWYLTSKEKDGKKKRQKQTVKSKREAHTYLMHTVLSPKNEKKTKQNKTYRVKDRLK